MSSMVFDAALVKYLEDCGVTYIFGVPGDIQTEFFQEIQKSSIRFITARNEKSAAFMADVYSRVSGEVGVCFSTVGPGATNLISGVTNATGDRSAVIAISDQTHEDFLESHQYVNQEVLFSPETGVTKYNATLTPENLRDTIARAYTEAMSEPKGAVHLSMPITLHNVPVKYEPVQPHIRPLKAIPHAKELAHMIQGKKALVILGGVVSRIGINKEITEWLEHCNLPALCTFRGKGSVPDNHPLFIGAISRYLADDIAPLFRDLDTLLLVGYDYNEGVLPSLWKECKGTIVNINTFDNTIPGVFEPKHSFIGDIGALVDDVRVSSSHAVKIQELKEQIQKKIYKDLDMDVYPPRPHKIIELINEFFPKAIKVCDIGKNKYYSGLLLNAQTPNSVIFSNMQSAMAFSSGALGATFATDEKIVVIAGDGGFMMDPQEIATAVRYSKNLVVVIFNDEGLGLVRAKQLKDFNKKYEVDFPNPDFVKFAESFGVAGYCAKSWGELRRIMRQVAEADHFAIIEVPVDYSEGI